MDAAGECSGDEPTAGPEYAQRLVGGSAAAGKRLLHVQAPYRTHVRRICPGRVLDLGCGIGRNLGHLGGRAVGVDHNRVSVGIARRSGHRAHITTEFADSSDGRLGSYDCLLLAHVLEHMTQARGETLLTAYLPYLRPGGRVVLVCPQERGYGSDPTHVEFLDIPRLTAMCRRAGLLVRRHYSFPLPHSAGRIFTHNEFVVLADKPRSVLA